MTAISVAASPAVLTVDSPASAVTGTIYTIAGSGLAAGITISAQITPTAIVPPDAVTTYSPIILAVRTTGRVQIGPPPQAADSTYVEPPRLLMIVAETMATPFISNGKPVSPRFPATCTSTATVS